MEIEFGVESVRVSNLWVRRLPDGRCLVLGVMPCMLPEGIGDAVVTAVIMPESGRDATDEGKGKTYLDIVESGWSRAVPATKESEAGK